MTRGRQLLVALAGALVVAALYGGLPAVAGLAHTWRRLGQGDAWWLALALALEVASYCGYALLFHAVFASEAPHRRAPQLGDHAGRRRGHTVACRGRCRRGGAHRLGTAPLPHDAAAVVSGITT